MLFFQGKLGILGFLLIITFCITTPAFAFQNEPDGFRGIKWGTNISELPDMGLVEDAGDLKYYSRLYDSMKIGDTRVDRIIYGFYKDRFYRVEISFSEFSNFTRLKATFLDQYGSGYKPYSLLEDYWWDGSTVSIVMDYNEILGKGRIIFFFKPISEEKKADDIQRAKKGVKDL